MTGSHNATDGHWGGIISKLRASYGGDYKFPSLLITSMEQNTLTQNEREAVESHVLDVNARSDNGHYEALANQPARWYLARHVVVRPVGERRDQETAMLVMMKYRFSGGAAGRQAYERFAKWTPSEGFEIKAGWTSASNDGGFLLLDVVDVATLLEFSAKFKDLNDELEITPVVELSEGVGIATKAYAWVDSLS